MDENVLPIYASPTHFDCGVCVLCGFLIAGPEDVSLVPGYAAIISDTPDIDIAWLVRDCYHDGGHVVMTEMRKPWVTGIATSEAIQGMSRASAPSDYRMRRNGAGPGMTAEEDIFRRRTRCPHSRADEMLAIGYQFHDRCWQLFCRRYHDRTGASLLSGNDENYENDHGSAVACFLFEMHQSTLRGLGHDWAGTYGGLFDGETAEWSKTAIRAIADPLDIFSEMAVALTTTTMTTTPTAAMPMPMPMPMPIFSGDPRRRTQSMLDRLPLEILQLIFDMLRISDLQRLWRASTCVPDPKDLPQKFWRSRFRPGRELGFAYEFLDAQRVASADIDWRTVYQHTQEFCRGATGITEYRLWNRRRVLRVLDRIIDLTGLYLDTGEERTITTKHNRAGVGASVITVKEPEGVFMAPRRSDLLACVRWAPDPAPPPLTLARTDGFLVSLRRLRVPSAISTVRVSTVDLDGKQYICGVVLQPSNGDDNDGDAAIGYIHPSRTRTVTLPEEIGGRGQVRHFGFCLDQRGIRGMFLRTQAGRTETLLDAPTDGNHYHSQALVPVRGEMIGAFDVLKLTAVGVDATDCSGPEAPLCWRPSPPPDGIIVSSHTREDSSELRRLRTWTMAYNPLSYHLFADQQDDQLVRITASLVHDDGSFVGMVGMEFTYRRSSHVLGSSTGEEKIAFHLDGEAGERITKVIVVRSGITVMGPVVTVHTNHGRSCCFKSRGAKISTGDSTSVLRVEEGESIAGFVYGPGGLQGVRKEGGICSEPFHNFSVLRRKTSTCSTTNQ